MSIQSSRPSSRVQIPNVLFDEDPIEQKNIPNNTANNSTGHVEIPDLLDTISYERETAPNGQYLNLKEQKSNLSERVQIPNVLFDEDPNEPKIKPNGRVPIPNVMEETEPNERKTIPTKRVPIPNVILEREALLSLAKVQNQEPLVQVYKPVVQEYKPTSLAELMKFSNDNWKCRDTRSLFKRIEDYTAMFKTKIIREEGMPGFLQKLHLPPETEIIVFGDIHGKRISVEVIFNYLRENNIIDENGNLKENYCVIFLGDLVDRGDDSLAVLEMILSFMMANATKNVFILRGNHEYAKYSQSLITQYAADDPRYSKCMEVDSNVEMLDKLYECFPFAVYLSQNTGIKVSVEADIKVSKKVQEYMQFSHAFAHLLTDPFPLFTSDKDYLWIDGKNKNFSTRINKLCRTDMKIKNACKAIRAIYKQITCAKKWPDDREKRYPDSSQYPWLDIRYFQLSDAGRWGIPPKIAKQYLKISGGVADFSIANGKFCVGDDANAVEDKCKTTIKVKRAVRGHQSVGIEDAVITQMKKGELVTKVVVTTLDPSNDDYYQTFIIYKIAEKVRDWERKVIQIPLVRQNPMSIKIIPNDLIPTNAHLKRMHPDDII